MIQLRTKGSGRLLGTISEEELQFLIDNLEEEWEEDKDYYINQPTLELLKSRGAPESLVAILEKEMGSGDIEIEWSRK